jgi:hypothetical protein
VSLWLPDAKDGKKIKHCINNTFLGQVDTFIDYVISLDIGDIHHFPYNLPCIA